MSEGKMSEEWMKDKPQQDPDAIRRERDREIAAWLRVQRLDLDVARNSSEYECLSKIADRIERGEAGK